MIDDEVAAALYRTGCRNVTYAPESGSPETLQRIRKRVKLPALLESTRAALRQGIHVKCNIVIGFPHESRRQICQTLRFCWKLAVLGVHDVGVFLFSPYPGSQLFDDLHQILIATSSQVRDSVLGYFALDLHGVASAALRRSPALSLLLRELGESNE